MKSLGPYLLLTLVFFACKRESETGTISTIPQKDVTYIQNDTLFVAAKGISTNSIEKISIDLIGGGLDSNLITKIGVGLEVVTDTIPLIIADSLQDSVLIDLLISLDDKEAVRIVTRELLYLTLPDTLKPMGSFKVNHFQSGIDNIFDHYNTSVQSYDSNMDSLSFTISDASVVDTLSEVWRSPAGLNLVSVSSLLYEELTHRSIQTAYYDGVKNDTINASQGQSILTLQEIDGREFFTAFKIDSTAAGSTPNEGFYIFEVKQFVK